MFTQSLNKVHFTSLGCPRNLVDTEVMIGILIQAGYQATSDMRDADYLVVNTCGFLESSRRESLDTIQMLINEKKPSAKVVVTGCMVQNHKDIIKTEIPEVSYLLGSGDVSQILSLITATESQEIITTARSYLQAGEVPRTLSTPKHYAYLKIAEGCLKRCSFCIIPQIKGNLKSKSVEQVLKEMRALLSQGVNEVILIAQDLGDWGKERKERFEDLLKAILTLPNNFKLRLLYLYPDEISDELIELIKSDSRILKYLDMPLQHINDEVLKTMRRKTNRAQIIEIITKLRRELPDVVIRTSLMVGFPGETEEQFEELCRFVQTHPLDNIGVFTFSSEKGAYAENLPNHISEEVKKRRYDTLMQIQGLTVEKLSRRWVGRKIPVVIEGYHPDSKHLMVGRFHGQCPDIDGQVIINDCRAVTAFGKEYLVEITDVAGYDLVGASLYPEKPKKNSSMRIGGLRIVKEAQ